VEGWGLSPSGNSGKREESFWSRPFLIGFDAITIHLYFENILKFGQLIRLIRGSFYFIVHFLSAWFVSTKLHFIPKSFILSIPFIE
jgi:hypothetical protein